MSDNSILPPPRRKYHRRDNISQYSLHCHCHAPDMYTILEGGEYVAGRHYFIDGGDFVSKGNCTRVLNADF